MARVPLKINKSAPFYLKLFFYFQKKKYGSLFEPVILWGRTPKVFLSFLMMQKALNRKKSPLDPILRALVTIKVSQINECAFCVDMNAFLLLQKGGSEDKLRDLFTFQESALFSEKEKVALEYTRAMTQASQAVSDELFQRLKQHYDEDAIIELTALIAFQNLSSKFNSALDAKAFGFCDISSVRK